MKILVKLFAIVPPLWPIWFLAEWWTFSKRPYPCFVDSRNPRFLQIFKTNAFTQLALKRFPAATYHPRVHRSTRSCSWCFLRKFCQSMSASHRWFSAKIRKPLLHWHFALWRLPTKCLLAENEEEKNNFNDLFACEVDSIDLSLTLIWKKLVRAIFVTGERTCCLAWMTFTRNASTAFRPMSSRYTRDINTSPLWLYTKRPPIIFGSFRCCFVSKIRSVSLVSHGYTWNNSNQMQISDAQYTLNEHETIQLNCQNALSAGSSGNDNEFLSEKHPLAAVKLIAIFSNKFLFSNYHLWFAAAHCHSTNDIWCSREQIISQLNHVK